MPQVYVSPKKGKVENKCLVFSTFFFKERNLVAFCVPRSYCYPNCFLSTTPGTDSVICLPWFLFFIIWPVFSSFFLGMNGWMGSLVMWVFRNWLSRSNWIGRDVGNGHLYSGCFARCSTRFCTSKLFCEEMYTLLFGFVMVRGQWPFTVKKNTGSWASLFDILEPKMCSTGTWLVENLTCYLLRHIYVKSIAGRQ